MDGPRLRRLDVGELARRAHRLGPDRSPRTARPVSYTHLDVYKRQAVRARARIEYRLSVDPCQRGSVSCVRPTRRTHGSAGRNRDLGAGPVSYTHLDVYKRQRQTCLHRTHLPGFPRHGVRRSAPLLSLIHI